MSEDRDRGGVCGASITMVPGTLPIVCEKPRGHGGNHGNGAEVVWTTEWTAPRS